MLFLAPTHWKWTLQLPKAKDPRWTVAFLLFTYVVLGVLVLGFSRRWEQILLLLGMGMGLDMLLSGLVKGEVRFPLSSLISCLSLAILLNFSLGFAYLWLPVGLAIGSKYVFTLKGKHVFNPSLFGICVSLWIGNELVSLSPAYQWFGNAETAWTMAIFIVTGAVLMFLKQINRHWLILSFLFFYLLQTALRAYILRNHIPIETLFIGTMTTPAFYLFTFYMITDPATSPAGKKQQIFIGFVLAALDLFFHTKFSLYTFFYAGFTVGAVRYAMGHLQMGIKDPTYFSGILRKGPARALFLILFTFSIMAFRYSSFHEPVAKTEQSFHLESISPEHSGIGSQQSDILEQVDGRVLHVAKWMMSVGDATAAADVDLDGDQDLFFTQTLKDSAWQAKLFLNQGDFVFEKMSIPDLESYLGDPVQHGLPSTALFFDYDNDGDKDLFVGFAFASSHLFENRMVQDGRVHFVEKEVPFLTRTNTACLGANAFDLDNDGYLELLITNAIPPYLTDYDTDVPFNLFSLPRPEYEGDRRMFHFMHESWHNANNGGKNHLLLNRGGEAFELADHETYGLDATRWSLATGTMDVNQDGYTDLYIANDFGRDDCYLNTEGKFFDRQQGRFFGDIGKDTYKGMNVSMGDVDGNGKEDIYISNVHHAVQAEGSLLWMNETDSLAAEVSFKERASQKNALNPNRFGWGGAMADLNLDGWLDILQVNGMVDDEWDKVQEEPEDFWYYQMQIARAGPDIHSYADKWADIRGKYIYPNEADRIYLNRDGHDFVDISEQVGFTHLRNTRGIAAVDLDNDGDLDVVVTDQFGAPFLYKNHLKDQQWLGIELSGNGRSCSSDAIGTSLHLSYTENGNPKTQIREVRLMSGFSAQGDSRLMFGLGPAAHQIRKLRLLIHWQDGKKETLHDLKLNQYHAIREQFPLSQQ
ncbi:MAG: FG-GAP-like repeat-containing protein [Bacteroidota bacterium]